MKITKIDHYETIDNGIEMASGQIRLRLQWAGTNILRLWSTTEKEFCPVESFVVEKKEFPSITVRIETDEHCIRLAGGELSVAVYFDPFWIEVKDNMAGNVLATPSGDSLEWNGEKAIQRFKLPAGIQVYGLGQGTSPTLNLRDQERRMWQQWDGYRYSGNGGIPFLMTSGGYGVLLNSSWASRFALGKARPAACTRYAKPEGPWPTAQHSGEDHPERMAILTEGGDMDLFIIYGPDYKRLIRGYCDLTGYPPLLPKWAYGWIQSKNRYKTQEELVEIGRRYRQKGLPGDVLVIDWCWFRYFGDLDWVRRYWPDPEGMARELKTMGFHLLLAQHPYMHQESPHYKDFAEPGYLITWDPADLPDDWPPDGIRHAVDFSHPGARKVWWKKIEPLFRQGMVGYWTDMGELDTHPPSTTPHYLGPREKVHNIYSTLWNKALYDGQRSVSNRRVFCLARTAYAGIQRYGSTLWSGDIDPSWEVLEDQVVTGQQVCLSGQPYWTTDIGGWMTTDFYEPELYIRWIQFGTFCPLFRTHGTRPGNEPWSFGPEAERIIRDYLNLRYRLMPYIYSLAYETTKTGLSFMRAMFIEFPGDEQAAAYNHQFMAGPSLLVAPVTKKGEREKEVWLPEGTWYDYWNGQKHTGPGVITEKAPLWKIPLFVRGGSIIPHGPEILHTGMSFSDPLTLHVYPGSDASFTLYEDDGETYDYEQGDAALTKITYHDKKKKLEISPVQGSYPGLPAERSFVIRFHDYDCPAEISINGMKLDAGAWCYEKAKRQLVVMLDRQSVSTPVSIEMRGIGERGGDEQEELTPVFFTGYDMEKMDAPFGYLLRIYLANTTAHPVVVKAVVQPATGWHVKAVDGEEFELAPGEERTVYFNLTVEGKAFTVRSMTPVIIASPYGEERKEIQLGSAWAGWWKIIGPYKVAGPEGFDTVFAPEQAGKQQSDQLEAGIKKILVNTFECFGYVNLEKAFGIRTFNDMMGTTPEYKLAYAACVVNSPTDKECIVQLMGEDRFKLWINNRLIAVVAECVAKPVEYPVQLKKGVNHILIKCTQDAHREWNDRSWGFFFRLVDEARKPLDDLIYSAEEE